MVYALHGLHFGHFYAARSEVEKSCFIVFWMFRNSLGYCIAASQFWNLSAPINLESNSVLHKQRGWQGFYYFCLTIALKSSFFVDLAFVADCLLVKFLFTKFYFKTVFDKNIAPFDMHYHPGALGLISFLDCSHLPSTLPGNHKRRLELFSLF